MLQFLKKNPSQNGFVLLHADIQSRSYSGSTGKQVNKIAGNHGLFLIFYRKGRFVQKR